MAELSYRDTVTPWSPPPVVASVTMPEILPPVEPFSQPLSDTVCSPLVRSLEARFSVAEVDPVAVTGRFRSTVTEQEVPAVKSGARLLQLPALTVKLALPGPERAIGEVICSAPVP